MTSPYSFNSDWDYYESLLTPLQRELNRICENDPVEFLEEKGLTKDFIDTYFEQIMDFCIDKEFVEEFIQRYLENQEEV